MNRPPQIRTPDTWSESRIADIAQIKSGSTPLRSKEERYFENGSIPWIKTMDLTNGPVFSTDEMITEIALRESSCPMLEQNTVLVAMYGGLNQIGRTGITTFSCTINQAISALIVDENQANPLYVLYWLNQNVRAWQRTAASSRKDPNITKRDVENFPILLPPLGEQRKIVQILCTWDGAIATMEQLIAALQRRKTGLMQRLLTGQVRFREFEDRPWPFARAGDIFQPRSKRKNGNEELLSATQDRGVIPRSMLEARVTMPSGATDGYKLVEQGDFVISLRTFQGGIEYSEYRGIVSPAYIVLQPNMPIVAEFYKHLFKSQELISRLAVAVIGIRDGKQISYEDFASIKLAYPCLDEQERIGQVLRTCDDEIGIHVRSMHLLRSQKKGLMQRLLTGQVRVQISEEQDHAPEPQHL